MGTPEALARWGPDHRGAQPSRRQMVTIIGGGDVGFRLAQRLDAPGHRPADHRARPAAGRAAGRRAAARARAQRRRHRPRAARGRGDRPQRRARLGHRQRRAQPVRVAARPPARRRPGHHPREPPANLRLFERVGIDVALSARGAAVASVVHQIQGGRAHLLAVLEEGQATSSRSRCPPASGPRADGPEAAADSHRRRHPARHRQAIVPRGSEDRSRPGDRLIVFTAAEAATRPRLLRRRRA
jgi:hypothetical protein